ncbi:MAG: transposase [Myxococcales bacterium]|nr:transposase [Myxococcales bacterium]
MARYSHKFRMQMVRRMVGANRMSATALAAEVGIPQPTLSRWLREAATVSTMKTDDTKSAPEKAARRPQDWTPEERLQAVLEARSLDGAELGAFLRSRGLHESDLAEWRQAAIGALSTAPRRSRRGRSPEQKRIRQLERELDRKDKALAETAALLVMLKKAEALWGDEGVGTREKSAKKRSR